jgi:hypothetical protein
MTKRDAVDSAQGFIQSSKNKGDKTTQGTSGKKERITDA